MPSYRNPRQPANHQADNHRRPRNHISLPIRTQHQDRVPGTHKWDPQGRQLSPEELQLLKVLGFLALRLRRLRESNRHSSRSCHRCQPDNKHLVANNNRQLPLSKGTFHPVLRCSLFVSTFKLEHLSVLEQTRIVETGVRVL